MKTIKIVFWAYVFVVLLRLTSRWWLPPLEPILFPESVSIEQINNFRVSALSTLRLVSYALIVLFLVICFGPPIYASLVTWLRKRKYYKAAIAGYTLALKLQLYIFGAYNNRGQVYFEMNDFPAALADFNKAIELQPDNADVYNRRGNTHFLMQNYPAALADYNKTIELQPDDFKNYGNRGLVYREIKDFPAALADFNKAIELQPNNADIYNDRGHTYFLIQEYPAALVDCNKAIELQPGDSRNYYNRGLVHNKTKDFPAALADCSKAIELQPDDDGPVYNMACTYALQFQVDEACSWLRRAIKMSSENIELATTDTDFDPIRDTPEFKSLMSEFEKNNL